MNLSEHFTLEEFTYSAKAVELNIDNTAPPEAVERLRITAAGLEQIRTLLGSHPMHISSGYRGAALNAAVGGVKSSAHNEGYAADFSCPAFGTPLDIVKRILAEPAILFDQLIYEGTWVHVSFAPRMRQQALTAHFKDGKATYTPFAES